MALPNNKKLSIIYTLKVLQDYSDEKHLLSQTEIANKINNIYGLECERKSIGANIESLIDLGYDIVKSKSGCCLASRDLEISEVRFLIDAVFSSKAINGKHARDLAKKLSQSLSVYERKQYNYLYKTEDVERAENKQIFYNIELLHNAIENNKQVSFIYNKYDVDGTLIPRRDKPFVINPYFMLNNMGNYYLVCNNDPFDDVANFRIEDITDIKILDSNIKPVTTLKGFEKGFDIASYINDNIYMFGDRKITAKIKIRDDYMVNQAKKWFGKNIRIEKENNQYYGYLKNSESSIVYWSLQYGESIEIIEPVETREKMKEIVKSLSNKYLDKP